MAYITIKQFADKHGVSRQAIEHALDKKIKIKLGVKVISEKTKYKPNKNMGPK